MAIALAGLSLTFLPTHPVVAQGVDLGSAYVFGGRDATAGNAITVDSEGNLYTTGSFSGEFATAVDFDPAPNEEFTATARSLSDVFVQKLDASGNFVWLKTMAGSGRGGVGAGIATDGSDNVFVMGEFYSTVDFDPGEGVFELTGTHLGNVFLQKLDASGNFLWAHAAENSDGGVRGTGVAADADGNAFVAGEFARTVLYDLDSENLYLTSGGETDVFLKKVDTNGTLLWAKRWGGTGAEACYGVATDTMGNVYVSGTFEGTVDFDPGEGETNLTAENGGVFVSKLDPSGNFVWATIMAASVFYGNGGITVDAAGNVYVTGSFGESVSVDTESGTESLPYVNGQDIFVQKLDTNGVRQWIKAVGTESADEGISIAVDGEGSVYTTGYFQAKTADFDPGPATYYLRSQGHETIFLQKLDADGNFVWAKAMSGNHGRGNSIALVGVDTLFATGYFGNTVDFDPGIEVFELTSGNDRNMFLANYVPDMTAPSVVSITPTISGPTNADSVEFTVEFSEDVLNFNAMDDMTITHTGTTSTGVTITGGPFSYLVSVDGISGDGSFTLGVDTMSDVIDTSAAQLSLVSSVTSVAVDIDNTAPSVVLNMSEVTTVEAGGNWEDPGATATDSLDGEFAAQEVTGTVESRAEVGTQVILTYTATDRAGNSGTVERSVTVVDTTPPTISLALDTVEFNAVNCDGSGYEDPGAIARDNADGALTVSVSGNVDTTTTGVYTLTYSAEDTSGNVAMDTRVVTVYNNCLTQEEVTAVAESLLSGFRSSDLNGDSQLSFSEAQAWFPPLTQAEFDAIDTNNDGQLNQAELNTQASLDDVPGGCFLTVGISETKVYDHLSEIFLLGLATLMMFGYGAVAGRSKS